MDGKSHFGISARLLAGLAILGALIVGDGLGAAQVSLDDCVTAALKASPALDSLRAEVLAADAATAGERDGLWPSLSVSDESDYSAYRPEAGFSDGPENMANAELSVDMQPWFTDPAARGGLDAQRVRVRLAQAKAQLRREIVGDYDHLMILRLKVAQGTRAVAIVDRHIKDIQRLLALGMDVELDLLRARSQRRTLEFAAVIRDAEIQDAVAALRSLTGLDLAPGDFQPDAAWIASALLVPRSDAANAQSLVGTLQGRLAALDLDLAMLATRGTGPLTAPTLKLGLNYAFRAIDPATPRDQAYAALTLDAFDWGRRSAEARQRARDLEAQQGESREQMRLLSLDAEQLRIDLGAARKGYALSVDLLDDAQKAMGIAQGYYRQGKLKETDLLSVLSDYLAAQDQRANALQTVLEKKADWDSLWDGGRS